MSEGIIIAIFGISGVAVGGLIQILTAWGIRRCDEKREYRKLAIEAGLEIWRHRNTLMVDLIKSGGSGNVAIEEPDAYIMHMLRIVNIASDMKITASEAANKIALWGHGSITSDGKPTQKPDSDKS